MRWLLVLPTAVALRYTWWWACSWTVYRRMAREDFRLDSLFGRFVAEQVEIRREGFGCMHIATVRLGPQRGSAIHTCYQATDGVVYTVPVSGIGVLAQAAIEDEADLLRRIHGVGGRQVR